jgi:uncharacterized protein (DUF1800 family)
MLKPLSAAKWSYANAAHLLNRAGFGGTPSQIESLVTKGLAQAVAELVDYEAIPDSTTPPAWAKPDQELFSKLADLRALRRKAKNAPPAERKELEEKARMLQRQQVRTQLQNILDLRGWWLQRMATGSRPLQEKLTLFWHGHFATSAQKVKNAYFMYLQNETFRKNASGNWLQILKDVTCDPAMLLWLDQAQSRKQHPNENYAREVMELFALGEGHYTEKDVTEAARAFTGLTLDRLNQKAVYRPFQHDTGTKTVLGRTGDLRWEDVLAQIVAHPQAPQFISGKLWRFFASEEPSEDLVTALSDTFRKNGGNFKPLLRAIFESEEFYSESVVRSQVKSPVQWLVSSVRLLERSLPPAIVCSTLMQKLGQELFAPPNVKGWDGGLAWITTNNLLARYNQAEMLVYGRNQVSFTGGKGNKGFKLIENRFNRRNSKDTPLDVTKLFSANERQNKSALLEAMERRFIQGKLKPRQAQALHEYLDSQGELDDHDILETIRLIMSTPEFQLC